MCVNTAGCCFSKCIFRCRSTIRDLILAGKPWQVGPLSLPGELSVENYEATYADIHKLGYIYTQSRSADMSLFGGTVMATCKAYQVGGVVVPRPNTACREGKSGYHVLQRPYVVQLAQAAEHKMIQYLSKHDPETLQDCVWFKENVPAELRVCGTMFNAMALVGDLRDGNNHIHVDKNDICSLIVMFGKNIKGGSTRYYDGPNDKEPGNIVHTEAFVHGKYQVGPFETTVHDGQPWKGRRGIISFYINRQMFAHFKEYGRVKYDAWLAGNTDNN